MKREAVKHKVGGKLAAAGIYRFAEAAATLGISRPYLSRIIGCTSRPARYQASLAKLCKCDPEDLFGPWTHPDIRTPRTQRKEPA